LHRLLYYNLKTKAFQRKAYLTSYLLSTIHYLNGGSPLTPKYFSAIIRVPLFRPVQRYWETAGQDGNIAAHLPLLCAAGIWGEVLYNVEVAIDNYPLHLFFT